MLTNVSLYSYGTALVSFSLLTLLVLATQWNRPLGIPFIMASLLTAVWAGIIAVSTLFPSPLIDLIQLAEVARNAAWSFLLLKMMSFRARGTNHPLSGNRWVAWYFIALAVLLVFIFARKVPVVGSFLPEQLSLEISRAVWLAMAILGLLLLEQIYRNSAESERWSIKHLCIGVGVLFTYDFFMYAQALLFLQLDPVLWHSRGLVVSLGAIFIAVASNRIAQAESDRGIYISRHVVFHSVTLLAAGIYLIVMALAGYFIRYMGGSWGGVLQIAFLCAAALMLLALLFSGKIRARTRVWLSKHFFSYKYDYRLEWLEFTDTLAAAGGEIPESVVKAMAHIVDSHGGLLWCPSENNQYRLECSWEMAEPQNGNSLGTLPKWLLQTEWIIDLKEWRHSPDVYENLDIPTVMHEIPRAWLIIPLMFGSQLQGILVLRESDLNTAINWEDRDLLKLAGRQAASHLAQYQANQALIEARQFEAFNRLSAYVVHDLKNILAQQSLIVSNAEKHLDNPAFIEDVINTIKNSVERMTRLMQQMRSGVRGKADEVIELNRLLSDVTERRKKSTPAPQFHKWHEKLFARTDKEQLATVFNHIIQNGQEATGKSGEVTVRLSRESDRAVVTIEDDGVGMDQDFLRDRLFKPFDSTKGLSGMGVGAFESREFIRALGGDIHVTSAPGKGSSFQLVLPCYRESPEQQNTAELEKESLRE